MATPYKALDGSIMHQTPEEKALGPRFFKLASKLLEEGKIKPPPYEVREGLEGALQGIDDLRQGKISGKKIVSRFS